MTPTSSPNPYDVLGVPQAASKAEIVKAVAVAMKLRRYPVDAIAKAQKSLMDSKKRILADYLRPILPTIQRFKRKDLSALAMPAPQLEFLPQFDGLDAAIESATDRESLDTEPLTVSRDYFITLPDAPRYKALGRGEILPATKSLTLKTVTDGQRLLYFEFLTLDGNRERLENIWLWLEQYYPRHTELLLTLELDETVGSLQITAALKNHPSVKVSCWLTCGGVDEDIFSQVDLIIQRLNKLALVGVKANFDLAGEVVFAATQIYRDGNLQAEQLEAAQTKLKQLDELACLYHYHQGIEYCKQKRYLEGIQLLEEICRSSDNRGSKDYLQALMALAKAYHASGQLQKARDLCQQLTKNQNMQVGTWARQALSYLDAAKVDRHQSSVSSQPNTSRND